ncbi:PREDICTED: UDP-N-acetylglucosamine/UDP-glucose/GDP-mannose transporter-like [Amphimedon queenslandica]|uniref:Sugar phosphate transporter domain-containing protein n=1 Tax=Amphimedon queenslandica TaxID=400682 RepID=A0A1X7VT71_AMPQE|nr:PREDICTED: UDP-N-acetylglucosamine/UDP-glucose/GDP-mannose transporter-like [Amphimedon queenslandica]|eukprot:XP_003382951.1 PREDICTED: UDP-N-acetylglucosamine/UDP-glucose/GDP-mannose transporter-like [Amphimedon queenslandica]
MAGNVESQQEKNLNERYKLMMKQVGASVFFGVISILIVMVNKTVLTTYHFPSFQVVGLGQIVAIIFVAQTAKMAGLVTFPDLSKDQVVKVFPLPIFYILNLIFGLGSTQKLSIPMFTVLRRFTLIFVSLGQIYLLNKRESFGVNVTLVLMILGAFVAALDDLAFDVIGYTYVIINDVASAANNLYIKKKTSGDMGSYEILFYNALLVLVPAVIIAALTGELQKAYDYDQWTNPLFLINFCLSAVMGFVLMYSQILCTQLTSALTMVVVGCIKNIVVTYVGMFVGGDYVYSLANFIGINISVVASLVYSVIKYRESVSNRSKPATSEENTSTAPRK